MQCHEVLFIGRLGILRKYGKIQSEVQTHIEDISVVTSDASTELYLLSLINVSSNN
jgi:hypothetical protein